MKVYVFFSPYTWYGSDHAILPTIICDWQWRKFWFQNENYINIGFKWWKYRIWIGFAWEGKEIKQEE